MPPPEVEDGDGLLREPLLIEPFVCLAMMMYTMMFFDSKLMIDLLYFTVCCSLCCAEYQFYG